MSDVKGADRLLRRFQKMASPQMKEAVRSALYVAGGIVQDAAQASITEGSVSGKNHQPSKPGEPPMNDTGMLMRGIIVEQAKDDPLAVDVKSTAPYSAALEFGTSKMIERPFMRPAAARTKGKVAKLVSLAVSREMEK